MLKKFCLFTAFTLAGLVSQATAQDATYDTILDGLNNPTGVAIQPGTGHVFVVDSGARRVIRVIDGKVEEVITGFPKSEYGKGPLYDIGPLGLVFFDQNTLVIGGGGRFEGDDLVGVYKIPAAGNPPIKHDQTFGEPRTIPKKDNTPGEGDFYGLVRTGRGIFVTCNGDDAQTWIALATMSPEGQLQDLSRSIALQEKTKTNAPTAITFSPDGYLAIGQMGTISAKPDSLLTFCDPEDGLILGSFETGLYDITGLAYGPKRGRLFATDFSWHDTSKGALVKLVGTDAGCESRLIVRLPKPTALAFSPNGDLYVTLAGNTSEGSPNPDGKLILIKGLDDDPANN